ncbi:MAG: IS21 family transposase [Deltaproteobacteria bacterium]|nr:IS21 family transposase [Deltaproteobacteria bacterium]
MRNIKEVLRLTYHSGLSARQVARSLNISRSTVKEYQGRAERAGIGWPVPDTLSDQELEQKLFPPAVTVQAPAKALPDFHYIYQELKTHKKFNLTLDLLWQEYKEQHPERRYRGKLDYSMRQDHRGGEKLFVDYGEGLSLVDPKSGEPVSTQLFVAVWGASNYTFAEATLTQQLPDWIGSHVRAFQYFGCAPKVVVPDCLKGAVVRACRYEPELNPTYTDLAEHYGICVLPARPARPRDKAKVENGVLIAKRWILAVLRHRTFYSLAELNGVIGELLERLNGRALRKLKQSRHELFKLFDHPNALSLPQKPYEYAEWKLATVNIDYHIEVERHYYSVPFRLIREKIHVRLTAHTVEAFFKGERVLAHVRSYIPYGHTTLKEHMPPAHQKYLEWTPSRIVSWAEKIGPQTATLVQKIIESRTYPEQAYRSCLGILRLEKHYPKERLEKAAGRALKFSALSLRSLRKILNSGLDRLEDSKEASDSLLPTHENIRGPRYYH